MDKATQLSGNEWQDWATQLLHCHYAKGDYQEIPDKYRGDAGLEGFSSDGRAYQMYGPEGELTTKQRHAKIRKKMTEDINKFINNDNGKISQLLGNTKIKKWILLVPFFDSRETVAHAAKKTTEVKQANPSYIDQDCFAVRVLGENAFKKERAELLSLGLRDIDISADPVEESDVDDWQADITNSMKLDHLASKLAKIPNLSDDGKQKAFMHKVIMWWMDGQNALDKLREYPDIWESIRHAKSEQEKYLEAHCMITDRSPYPLLKEALDKLDGAVQDKAKSLTVGSRDAITHEAVADWLMRCPLDFPELAQ